MEQEPQQDTVVLSAVERAPQGVIGGVGGAQLLPGDGRQQECLGPPSVPPDVHRAVEDRAEHGERGVRGVLFEPQRCGGHAHPATGPFSLVEVG